MNEGAFLESSKVSLSGYPIPYQGFQRRTPTFGNVALKGFIVQKFLTVSDNSPAKTRQKQISHDVVGPDLLNSAATKSDISTV